MLDRRLGWEIERIILLMVVGLGLADFFSLLPPFFVFLHEMIDWITIGYVIYAVSPTELFFGERSGGIDLTIVASYVLLSIKDFVGNAVVVVQQSATQAGAYIAYAASNATVGVPFPVSTAELNSYQLLRIVPRAGELAASLSGHFTTAQQQINVILTDGVGKAAVTAFPTGMDGAMLSLYNTVIQYSGPIQVVALITGTLLLLGASVYAAYALPVRRPSILAMVKEEGEPDFGRIAWLFILLMAFFVMVFNLLFEWVALAIDAPLLVISIVAVGFLYMTRHAWSRGDSMLEAVEESGEEFFSHALRMLKDIRTVLLIISGLLVLHLLTDIGNFLFPALLPFYQSSYTQATGGQTLIYTMAAGSFSGSLAGDIAVIAAYALSVLGLFLLLLLPGIIWYKLFKLRSTGSREHIPDWRGWQVGLVLACILTYALLPVYRVVSLRVSDAIGVNLIAAPITAERALGIPFVLSLALGVFALCVIVGMVHDLARRVLMLGPFLAAVVFFGVYVYNYFTSAFVYYAQSLVALIRTGETMFYAVVPTMFILFGLTILFFVTGFFSFLYEIWRD